MVHRNVAAPPLGQQLADLPVIAGRRHIGLAFEFLAPATERIAKPWRLGPQLGQTKLFFPDDLGFLHEFPFGQRDGRQIAFKRRIDQQGGIVAAPFQIARPVPHPLVCENMHVEMRPRAVGHGPQDSIGALRVDIVIDDDDVERVMETIRNAANTDKIGDGKIFVLEVAEAMRIRTGETGSNAI